VSEALQGRLQLPIMHKALALSLAIVICLSGCKKLSAPSAPRDAVERKLQELAGSGATDCGRLKTQDTKEMKAASDCAMQAAQSKQPFYVGYDMPGLTVATAGNTEGKLFAVQVQGTPSADPNSNTGLTTGPCPAQLRVAPSGRVTCFPPGAAMPGGMSGGNPHAGVSGTGSGPSGGFMEVPSVANPKRSSKPAPRQ
jgi:hypothetical protein